MQPVPLSNHRHKICIICEGDEEYEYISRLINLAVWDGTYEIIPRNAHGESKIPPLYTNLYQNDRYELVLVFCDTDKAPHKHYNQVKSKINEFHGESSESLLASEVIIFANPCSMQIILSHFGDVSLTKQGKKTNADVIERLTSVIGYDAHLDQIKAVCNQVTRSNYLKMKQRVALLDKPDTKPASTNFIRFLQWFESDDPKWIREKQAILDHSKFC